MTSLDVWVLKRGELKSQLSRDLRQSMGAFSPATANMAYELLNRYARADEAVKDAHVAAIKRQHGGRSCEERVIRNPVEPAAVAVPVAVAQGGATASGSCPSCGGEPVVSVWLIDPDGGIKVPHPG